MAKILLTIQHGDVVFSPPIKDDIVVEWERVGTPGKLTFTTVKVDDMNFYEGDAVTLQYDGKKIFMGYVFTKKRNKDQHIEVTCYDQIRYLKNKYTYVFEKKTAKEIIKAMCKDYNLNIGTFDDTKYKIPAIAEENKAALDISLSVLEETLLNTGNQYTLYDDFGKLMLKNSANMISDTLIMESTAEDFDYKSSIDEETYNSIVLYYKPKAESSTTTTSSSAQASKIIQIAASKIGSVGPGSPAWCCYFCWWVFKQAGLSSLLYNGNKIGYCPTLMSWFKGKGRFYRSNPQPGDLVFFDWDGNGTPNHVGIVEKVHSGSVTTIEGNASNRVKRLRRSSGILGYGRPAYTSSESTTTTTQNTAEIKNKIQIFTASDKNKIKQWGTLRYYEAIDKPAIGKSKAKQLLKLYARKTRELKITAAFGDPTVRGGTLIPVKLDIGEMKISNYMLVEKVTHTFNNDHHTMDLTLGGWWED
jgi:hypothetical protein